MIQFLLHPGAYREGRLISGAARVAQWTADWFNAQPGTDAHCTAVAVRDEEGLLFAEGHLPPDGWSGRCIYRIHCNADTLALRAQAVRDVLEARKRGYRLAANDPRAVEALQLLCPGSDPLYLPNLYPCPDITPAPRALAPGVLQVGCLGRVATLKNQFAQGLAAIAAAEHLRRQLLFHINAVGVEDAPHIICALRELFSAWPRHTLIEHPWLDYPDFRALVAQMDVVMAASYSESFCVTAADAVSQGVPVVGSAEIPFIMPRTDLADGLQLAATEPYRSRTASRQARALAAYVAAGTLHWAAEMDRLTLAVAGC